MRRALGLALLILSWTAGGAAQGKAAYRWAAAVLPSGDEFSLEVAADEVSRERGLMFRDQLGAHEGMLFVFEASDRHAFWMKNCRIPLDIVWLDADFRVVDIADSRRPCPAQGDCPTITPLRAARFVVELAGGTARKLGLKLGDRVEILTEPPLR